MADERAEQLLGQVPAHQRTECWWLVLDDGTLIAGDKGGGLMLLVQLHRTRWAGRALLWLRLSPIVDALDHLLARSRKQLGRFVPQGEAPVRYP
ncbi:MAG TPA: hypothetical protein VFZ87_08535 [Gemmatimonadales bacterium]